MGLCMYVHPKHQSHSIGVVKNLSVTCEKTNNISITPILYYLNEYIILIETIDIIKFNKQSYTKLFINGDP